MEIPIIAEESAKKGIDVVGTGDILNPKWASHMKNNTTNKKGIRSHNDIKFVLTSS